MKTAFLVGLLVAMGACFGLVDRNAGLVDPDAGLSDPGPTSPPWSSSGGMVRLPAGTFWMGSPDGVGEKDEHPRHQETVAAFEMDVTEVSTDAYEACIAAKGCTPPDDYGIYCNRRRHQGNHPINCVIWNQAEAHCAWAGKRLPTEVEWEYAARGTDERVYPWGNDEPANQPCWNRLESRQGTCEVGSSPGDTSPFGVRDMAGNVYEWTSSLWSKDYNSPRDSPAPQSFRVTRGSAWGQSPVIGRPTAIRGASRGRLLSVHFDYYLGFRCAR